MTPSRLKFTIKMLNLMILLENNFFLTFYHLSVLGPHLEFHVFCAVEILMVYFSLYATTTLVPFVCTIMLCSAFVIWGILTASRNHRWK